MSNNKTIWWSRLLKTPQEQEMRDKKVIEYGVIKIELLRWSLFSDIKPKYLMYFAIIIIMIQLQLSLWDFKCIFFYNSYKNTHIYLHKYDQK